MPGTYTHTTRSDGSILTGSIYNGDHQNHITFNTPGGCDDFSTNVAQMQSAADPGDVGTESLPTDLAGELQRVRFTLLKLKQIIDPSLVYWYQTPASLSLGPILGTEVVTTSGTTVDFTGIPSGVKRIILLFNGVSLSGTDLLCLRLGDAGGIEDTGYVGYAFSVNTTGATGTDNTIYFPLHAAGSATNAFYGAVTLYLRKASTFSWTLSGNLSASAVATQNFSSGAKSLSAELTQLQLLTSGANTFDAGTVNITYER